MVRKITFWENKKVFITGNTGFKGTWLTILLLELGAKIKGYSLDEEKDSLFNKVSKQLKNQIENVKGDIRDYDLLKKEISVFGPEIIIHLAAQPLVIESYKNPLQTWDTNLMGTLNLLEAITNTKFSGTALIITTDKVYWNNNSNQQFKEDDFLGGYDPYSASKAATEIAVASWRLSFLDKNSIKLATARAGNVIGGGDWAKNRIIPDAIKSILKKDSLKIRNPYSSRPWQHVLDPLNGYLNLIEYLEENNIEHENKISSYAFNFGPNTTQNKSVLELIEKIYSFWPRKYQFDKNTIYHHESESLNLCINKSQKLLDWNPKLNFDLSVEMTTNWYKDFYLNSKHAMDICLKDINNFLNL
ncbi:CDP-glucose 4,6-dehydratase [Prochlorococcus sp. MIT 9116]|uniref:CDP-glucose 4,6-dehydratase n=1 Tax=Prochlorococcus sp. MIT 9116 TaxID=3082533 RepID=UPI0039A42CDD